MCRMTEQSIRAHTQIGRAGRYLLYRSELSGGTRFVEIGDKPVRDFWWLAPEAVIRVKLKANG